MSTTGRELSLEGSKDYDVQNTKALEAAKITRDIHKTALGAENMVTWEYHTKLMPVLQKLKQNGYVVAALEQTDDSHLLHRYHPPQ
mgnify:CR=1 FL=1